MDRVGIVVEQGFLEHLTSAARKREAGAFGIVGCGAS
jgi:hypothetical protein